MKEHTHLLHKAAVLIIVGLIVLLNELYLGYSWWVVLGVLLVVKGIVLLVLILHKFFVLLLLD